jgi:hypothetical protein
LSALRVCRGGRELGDEQGRRGALGAQPPPPTDLYSASSRELEARELGVLLFNLCEVLLVLDLELVEVDVVEHVADLLLRPQSSLGLYEGRAEALVLQAQLIYDGVLGAQLVLVVLYDALRHDLACGWT